MQQFAFIIHPIDVRRDVARHFPIARYLPEQLVEWYIRRRDPVLVAEITGIRSETGEEARGWFIGCPLTPRQMLGLPFDAVMEKLQACGEIAQSLGAGIVGLGAFTSIVGDGGVTLASRLPNIAVTTGNSYTVAAALEGAAAAAQRMGHRIADAQVAVVGATGSIGATCAELLSREAAGISLVGRDETRLRKVAERLRPKSRSIITTETDVQRGIRDAQIIVTVTSALDTVIEPEYIRPGAVICDVARPRDVSRRVARRRNDVFVLEGGVVAVPGEMRIRRASRPDRDFNFGFPGGTAYACMSETMVLALEGRYKNFTLGKEVSIDQVDEISRLASKHGFRNSGFRSFERAVSDEEIERIRVNAFGAQTLSHRVPDLPAVGRAQENS